MESRSVNSVDPLKKITLNRKRNLQAKKERKETLLSRAERSSPNLCLSRGPAPCLRGERGACAPHTGLQDAGGRPHGAPKGAECPIASPKDRKSRRSTAPLPRSHVGRCQLTLRPARLPARPAPSAVTRRPSLDALAFRSFDQKVVLRYKGGGEMKTRV